MSIIHGTLRVRSVTLKFCEESICSLEITFVEWFCDWPEWWRRPNVIIEPIVQLKWRQLGELCRGRIKSNQIFPKGKNPTTAIDFVSVWNWSTTEHGLSCISACLPSTSSDSQGEGRVHRRPSNFSHNSTEPCKRMMSSPSLFYRLHLRPEWRLGLMKVIAGI